MLFKLVKAPLSERESKKSNLICGLVKGILQKSNFPLGLKQWAHLGNAKKILEKKAFYTQL